MGSYHDQPRKQRRLLEAIQQRSLAGHCCSTSSEHPLSPILTKLTKQIPLTTEDTRRAVDFRKSLQELLELLSCPDVFIDGFHGEACHHPAGLHFRQLQNCLILAISYHSRLSTPAQSTDPTSLAGRSPLGYSWHTRSRQAQQRPQVVELMVDCLWRLLYQHQQAPTCPTEESQISFRLLMQTILRNCVSKGSEGREWNPTDTLLIECASKLSADEEVVVPLPPQFRQHCELTLRSEKESMFEERARQAVEQLLQRLTTRSAETRPNDDEKCSRPTATLPWLQDTNLHPSWSKVLLSKLDTTENLNQYVQSILLSIDPHSRTEQVKQVLSILAQRVLLPVSEEEEEQLIALKEDRRQEACQKMLLPLLIFLREHPTTTTISVAELSEIWQLLLTDYDDSETVARTLLSRYYSFGDDDEQQKQQSELMDPNLWTALARVVVADQMLSSSSSSLSHDFLQALAHFTIQHSDSSVILVRRPALRAAVTRGFKAATPTAALAAQIVWHWSDFAGNHGILAHEPGTLACLIGMVRRRQQEEDGLSPGREEWKARILEIAEAL